MTGDDMKRWRRDMGFSQAQAAEALDLSVSAIANFEAGVRRGRTAKADGGQPVTIKRHIALACAALRRRIKPYPECERGRATD